eukprot:scaffold3895_cov203-Skeletonema_dohrnii-CCMP3373.AAC.1
MMLKTYLSHRHKSAALRHHQYFPLPVSSPGAFQHETSFNRLFNSTGCSSRMGSFSSWSLLELFFPHGEFQFLEFAGAVLPAWGVQFLSLLE